MAVVAAGVVKKTNTSGHMPRLDGLRGIAIILVMFFHLVFFRPACGVDHLFHRFTQYGWTGVDLFFILSGFLITGILLDAKGAPNYFRNFYVRRCLRILPLYYAFVIGLIFLYPLAGPHFRAERDVLVANQPWLWTHTINWLVAKTGSFTSRTTLGTGGFWSLAIEEQYYLVWPVMVLLLSRRALFRTCIGLAVFSIAIRFVMAHTGWSWAATFARFDPRALAIVARDPAALTPLRRYAWLAAGLALGGLAVIRLRAKGFILANLCASSTVGTYSDVLGIVAGVSANGCTFVVDGSAHRNSILTHVRKVQLFPVFVPRPSGNFAQRHGLQNQRAMDTKGFRIGASGTIALCGDHVCYLSRYLLA
jgi:peptidoglycan/LPS O-acetylase OafA/YrhL